MVNFYCRLIWIPESCINNNGIELRQLLTQNMIIKINWSDKLYLFIPQLSPSLLYVSVFIGSSSLFMFRIIFFCWLVILWLRGNFFMARKHFICGCVYGYIFSTASSFLLQFTNYSWSIKHFYVLRLLYFGDGNECGYFVEVF